MDDDKKTVVPNAAPAAVGRDVSPSVKRHHNRILLLISAFKCLKALGALTAGIIALHFLHASLLGTLSHWANMLRVNPHNKWVDMVLDKAAIINHGEIRMAAIGAFVYAALFTTEGIGLYFEKVWAEWLVIAEVSLLFPFEIYAISQKPDWLRIAILIGNMFVLAYLIYLRIKASVQPDSPHVTPN
jgi:uncharacterized membrane protein (DUF2068 family)